MQSVLKHGDISEIVFGPGDEPRNFHDRLTHWVVNRNSCFSEAEPNGYKNQVDVPKIKRQIKAMAV